MAGLFISYRRSDSLDASQATYNKLSDRFRWADVFMDLDGIPPGRDFRLVIDAAMAKSTVVLAMIGPHWLDAVNEEGARRLDNPADFVRLELETAFARKIPVVIVLVHGASAPSADRLPHSLAPLVSCPTIVVRPGPQFEGDTKNLMQSLAKSFPAVARYRPPHAWITAAMMLSLISGIVYEVVFFSTLASGVSIAQATQSPSVTRVLVGNLALSIVAAVAYIYALFTTWRLKRGGWFVSVLLGWGLIFFGLFGPRRPPGAQKRVTLPFSSNT